MHLFPSLPVRAVVAAALLAWASPAAWSQAREAKASAQTSRAPSKAKAASGARKPLAKPRVRADRAAVKAPDEALAPAPEAKTGREPQAQAQVESEGLALQDMVARLRQANRSILSKQAEADITATGIERAQAAFQPQASLGAVRGRNRMKNTFEEELIRQNLGVYDREGTDYSAGVSTVLPATGAKVELKSSVSRFITNNNRNDPLRPPGAYDNRSATGISLTQPLARDAGGDVTQAKLSMARLDSEAADHAGRDTEASVVAEGVLAYHELVFAQLRAEAAQEKIQTSARLLDEARALRRQGRLAQADVWEVENALARYKSALSEAVQFQRERSNRLRAMLMMEPSQVLLRATDALPAVDGAPVDAAESLRIALSKRDDYQMRKTQAEREGVQLAYARNQKLPRIDLVASYGVNGLEYNARRAMELNRARDYPAWSLGLQVNVPLGANKQADADLQAATLRREDALLGLKAIEVQIAADVDTSVALLASMSERWALWREVAAREAEQLQAERAKFAAGRSDTRELLLRQERVVNARLSVQEQQVGHARARTLLQAAQGTLLESFP